jgi:3-oxoacyl-[acyl-carrier protein] reductase
VNFCVKHLGVPHIVVNNAGTTHRNQPMLDVDEATFDRVFNVNVKSIFHMAKAVVPLMRQQGQGSIINIGSTAGLRPRPGLTWYNASKGAVNLLSKSMAAELGPDGIRVNAICPGLVDGPRIQSVIANKARSLNVSHEEMTEHLFSGVSIKQFVDPHDIAKQIVFLASPYGKTISGQDVSICGDTRMLR